MFTKQDSLHTDNLVVKRLTVELMISRIAGMKKWLQGYPKTDKYKVA